MPANRIFVLGLTGGIGCGKSEAAALLVRLGAAHIDADAISRSLTAPGGCALPAIRERFGNGVFRDDGSLDRQALSNVVFGDPAERAALEAITHPAVLREMRERTRVAETEGYAVAVWDVPLLYETGMDGYCDEVWVLTAPEEIQAERVMQRGLTREEALARIRSQLSNDEKVSRASRAIRTDRPLCETQEELTALFGSLLGGVG